MSKNSKNMIKKLSPDSVLETDEAQLKILREKLSKGKVQADNGEVVDGEEFIQNLISEIQKYASFKRQVPKLEIKHG